MACSNGEPPFITGRIPETSDVRETRDEVSLPNASEWMIPVPYPENMIPLLEPFLPERVMSPVVFPPMVRVLFLRDCRVEVAAVRERPLLLVVAERVATGVPFETFVIAN